MSQTKTKTIKALVGAHTKNSPAENLAEANAVHAGIFTDPTDFPAPPLNEATFKGAIDALSVKITAAQDGGKKAIAARHHQEGVVIQMMRQQAHYAEDVCKDDMPKFLKTGFKPKPTVLTSKPPLTKNIRKITDGNKSGEIHLVLVDDGADAHEIRCAPIVNGVPGTPVTQLVTKTRPAATITGLTPVTAYSIQVRSFADATGFSDWSDPITHTVK
jgi:hypothetical protein